MDKWIHYALRKTMSSLNGEFKNIDRIAGNLILIKLTLV